MSILKEFREFAVKGNVVDMAVGVIIGGAFGKIVSSLVSDVVMPPIGWLIGGVDFKDLAIEIAPAKEGAEAVMLKYGAFIQNVFDFLIIAIAVFGMVKVINKIKKPAEATPAEPTAEEKLLTEIRDLLKK
ncbi:large-conductance mechanosensitive channel protein MscL [Actinobacillus pleuropneumoniae]|uniref:Large-conductance mechanosensitive channel n=1 Tax=Actinobacillus pleuropneumoniae TaxID=715 RepID=A0A9Q4H6K7_ACTPL|nr:large-conductance mechanosensitive channel protein MscL [Actinobacillus pleuropneumoniae]MCL7721757.1 large-conductance mechanosensitive channel protein MscL [Actinobacillus pleuropneumoniae]MCL7728429.1 large-conductance mechanosensitive channel protein MscL [Actinobacillus pleuropneumoniae]MCL7729931.1 large-conductance mechanosensitive channel protein MscL [Actinobacillus pleuropneumoniae]MCY6368521.1 large-conductance mechanosensitive channel protein MscL [Actinobacillus pleuropneumoniae